jgi:hypothetical protein
VKISTTRRQYRRRLFPADTIFGLIIIAAIAGMLTFGMPIHIDGIDRGIALRIGFALPTALVQR